MSDLLPFETPGAVERDLAEVISPIEQIIDDARNGRMFVLVDHFHIYIYQLGLYTYTKN